MLSLGRRTGVIEGAARIGDVSRGAVYLSIGAIALLKARDLTPHARGGIGALQAWAHWSVGIALLWLIGLGLCGLPPGERSNRFIEIERVGHGPKGLAGRIGKAVGGIVYGTRGYEP
jgi:hypothetical protein